MALCLSVRGLFLQKAAYMRMVLDLNDYSQAYNMLTETAVRQITIQNALRHSAMLGG